MYTICQVIISHFDTGLCEMAIKDNYKTRLQTFKFYDVVQLILEVCQ